MKTMMFWYGSHWVFWQAALMWIGMIIFWGLLIWGIYALVTSSRRSGSGGDRGGAPGGYAQGGPGGAGHQSDSALRILDERLARGEIDAAEYRRLRDLIRTGGARETTGSGAKQ
ncbi:MAG: SHOCT domain-containing protein [Actinomycetota bacterium]|jgi:putative membrane protein|nr:SHOCT domain-containing protein [Actinomycetota bacterium]